MVGESQWKLLCVVRVTFALSVVLPRPFLCGVGSTPFPFACTIPLWGHHPCVQPQLASANSTLRTCLLSCRCCPSVTPTLGVGGWGGVGGVPRQSALGWGVVSWGCLSGLYTEREKGLWRWGKGSEPHTNPPCWSCTCWSVSMQIGCYLDTITVN